MLPGVRFTFDVALFKGVLSDLTRNEAPFLTLIGHTPWAMELVPALSVWVGLPLLTDVVDILLEQSRTQGHQAAIQR